VGGQKIQEVDGTYLLARALLDFDNTTFEKWRVLVGDTPELTNPSEGVFAGGTNQTGYPSVFPNASSSSCGSPIPRLRSADNLEFH
jgi:hypothetical protein